MEGRNGRKFYAGTDTDIKLEIVCFWLMNKVPKILEFSIIYKHIFYKVKISTNTFHFLFFLKIFIAKIIETTSPVIELFSVQIY